jgi:hypothetical protein
LKQKQKRPANNADSAAMRAFILMAHPPCRQHFL